MGWWAETQPPERFAQSNSNGETTPIAPAHEPVLADARRHRFSPQPLGGQHRLGEAKEIHRIEYAIRFALVFLTGHRKVARFHQANEVSHALFAGVGSDAGGKGRSLS